MSAAARAARGLTLAGYFGLLLLLLNWYTWLDPPQTVPISLLLLLLVAPLLLPMRGLLHGSRYAHGWSGFMALFYFALGVDVAFNDVEERLYGLLQVLFSTAFFVGCTLYLKTTRPSKSAPTATASADPANPPD